MKGKTTYLLFVRAMGLLPPADQDMSPLLYYC